MYIYIYIYYLSLFAISYRFLFAAEASLNSHDQMWSIFAYILIKFFLFFSSFVPLRIVKESCLILLQTIPGSIDIDLFKADLLRNFESIVSVHDLHIWQLTASKYVSTVHITFQTPSVSYHHHLYYFNDDFSSSLSLSFFFSISKQ